MIHMGSDHRCVTAKFEIPLKTKRKTRHSEVTPRKTVGDTKNEDQVGQTCEEGFEARYKDLEQEVKDAEPVKKQNSKRRQQKKKTVAVAAAQMTEAAKEEASEVAAAANGEAITRKGTEAAAAEDAPEAEGTKDNDEEILALIHDRKTIKKDEKDRIREVRKKIKKYIREKDSKARKNPKDLRRPQRNKEHLEHQVSRTADSHPGGQKHERRNHHNEKKELQMCSQNSTKNCMKTTKEMK